MQEKVRGVAIVRAVRSAADIVIRSCASFVRDDCLNLAANISFYALLALIPIGMMMVSIAGYFLGGSESAFQKIVVMAGRIIPFGQELFEANLQSVLDQRSSLGIVGVLFLVFIATLLVGAVERALDIVFKSEKRRHFLHSHLLGIAIIFLVTLLFALPTMAQILEVLFERYGFQFPLSELMIGKIFFLVMSFSAYLLITVIIPNKKVYLRYASVGGIVFAIGTAVTKFLFRWYMSVAMQRYNVIYGSLTAVVLLVIWIYYFSVVSLFTAELVNELQKKMLFHRK